MISGYCTKLRSKPNQNRLKKCQKKSKRTYLLLRTYFNEFSKRKYILKKIRSLLLRIVYLATTMVLNSHQNQPSFLMTMTMIRLKQSDPSLLSWLNKSRKRSSSPLQRRPSPLSRISLKTSQSKKQKIKQSKAQTGSMRHSLTLQVRQSQSQLLNQQLGLRQDLLGQPLILLNNQIGAHSQSQLRHQRQEILLPNLISKNQWLKRQPDRCSSGMQRLRPPSLKQ